MRQAPPCADGTAASLQKMSGRPGLTPCLLPSAPHRAAPLRCSLAQSCWGCPSPPPSPPPGTAWGTKLPYLPSWATWHLLLLSHFLPGRSGAGCSLAWDPPLPGPCPLPRRQDVPLLLGGSIIQSSGSLGGCGLPGEKWTSHRPEAPRMPLSSHPPTRGAVGGGGQGADFPGGTLAPPPRLQALSRASLGLMELPESPAPALPGRPLTSEACFFPLLTLRLCRGKRPCVLGVPLPPPAHPSSLSGCLPRTGRPGQPPPREEEPQPHPPEWPRGSTYPSAPTVALRSPLWTA